MTDKDDAAKKHTEELTKKHTPLGKQPLFNHPGQHLPNYVENIAHSLIEKQGMDKSQAIATALSDMHKYANPKPGQNIRPEVQAAAKDALHEWDHLRKPPKK